jgi:hypothetical protein
MPQKPAHQFAAVHWRSLTFADVRWKGIIHFPKSHFGEKNFQTFRI